MSYKMNFVFYNIEMGTGEPPVL